MIIFCLGCSYNFIESTWDHYSANPTIVTIKKDFRNWENPFPAATACFVNKVDEVKAKEFIKMKWGISEENDKYVHYLDFIRTVSNLTYDTFHNLQKFQNDSIFIKVDWILLLQRVHPDLNGVLVTFQTKVKPEWQFVMTELGLCFTLNSKFVDLLSPNFNPTERLKFTSKNNLKCHYLNGLCYARYDSDPNMPLQYYIHSPLEIVHATSELPLLVQKSEEFEINFKLIETYSLDDIRYLTAQQRKCRFDDEPLTDNVPVYSASICYMECRYRLAMERCGCKPFFYVFLNGKQCDISGLLCLSEISNLFNQSPQMFGCNCPQPCNFMVYLKQAPKITKWDTGYFDQRITFRWGLMPPTTKYQRKIIFGFQELIVSFGGVLSLFLGISFITFAETLFLTCNFFYGMFWRRKQTQKIQVNVG